MPSPLAPARPGPRPLLAGLIAAVIVLAALPVSAQMRPGPRPRGDEAPAPNPPANMSPGKQLVWDALEKQGGASKLSSIRDFKSELNVEIHSEDGTLMLLVEETWAKPGKLRTLVTEDDGNVLETAWDGRTLHISNNGGKWKTLTADEAGKDYRDTRENLRRIDNILGLFAADAEFEVVGKKRVRVSHTGLKTFEFLPVEAATPPSREGGSEGPVVGAPAPVPEDEGAAFSTLDLIAVERREPIEKDEPITLYVNATAGHETEGFVVGVSGKNLDGSSSRYETLWFRDFQPCDTDKSLLVPRIIQVYRTPDLDGIREIQSLVEIYRFRPDSGVKDSLFSPR